jgi:hypothetical protein
MHSRGVRTDTEVIYFMVPFQNKFLENVKLLIESSSIKPGTVVSHL